MHMQRKSTNKNEQREEITAYRAHTEIGKLETKLDSKRKVKLIVNKNTHYSQKMSLI